MIVASSNHNLPTMGRLKQRAKKLKKEKGLSQTQAYAELSKQYGFPSWDRLRKAVHANEGVKQYLPPPSLNFTADEDVVMTDEDYEILDTERSSSLAMDQKVLIAENKRELTRLGVEFSIFEPTKTGLNKSIIDAIHPVRTHFALKEFHFYSDQKQGVENKVEKSAFLLSDETKITSKVSLYRPNTKKGDPRMWFSKLPSYCNAGEQLAIVINNDALYLLNLSKFSIIESRNNPDSGITIFLKKYCETEFSTAEELLHKLKNLALHPLPALKSGDTGVGFTIETMLGIEANSSKDPDYKGIEIKSGRSSKTRTTLFAQVPNWDRSPCKKSAEILNKYGYERGDDFKLYCTLSTMKENSQGLSFIYDETTDEIQEWYQKKELVAVWSGELLRKRLQEKHAETFWIKAKSEVIEGQEYFRLISVTHTRAPILSQFMPLIQAGVITMDHLIKRSGGNNRVSEKGPLFKINKNDLCLLFPEPIVYILNE